MSIAAKPLPTKSKQAMHFIDAPLGACHGPSVAPTILFAYSVHVHFQQAFPLSTIKTSSFAQKTGVAARVSKRGRFACLTLLS
jgi:hypothetical protein